jgi:integrase/recombinase XerD
MDMDDETVAPVARAALMNTMLGPYVAQYCRYLRHRRYAAQTRHTYLGCIAHFARWLAVEGLGLEEADEQAGRRFVSTHLPHCGCPPPVRRTRHEVRAAVSHLHQVLRSCGALPESAPGDTGPIASELAAFDRYMDAVRGLAASTRQQRGRIVGTFLAECFGDGPLSLAYSDEIARGYRSQTARRSNLKARTIPISNRPGWCRLVGRFRHVTGANSGSIYRRQRGLLFC